MKDIDGKVSVVTGAASGIGRSTAVALAREGSHVALVDVNATGLEKTRELVSGTGRRSSTHLVDVAQLDAMQALVAAVEREHSGADILVNNAGVSVAATFEQNSLEDFRWLMGINF
jgi:NAD(P)-dependent dehydrogenase (short-subunit alcohol dehydrogenase family)